MVPWTTPDLESFEAISQDDAACAIFLKMAELSESGRMPEFLRELVVDPEIDAEMAGTFTELASDRVFLLAVADYVHRTERLH